MSSSAWAIQDQRDTNGKEFDNWLVCCSAIDVSYWFWQRWRNIRPGRVGNDKFRVKKWNLYKWTAHRSPAFYVSCGWSVLCSSDAYIIMKKETQESECVCMCAKICVVNIAMLELPFLFALTNRGWTFLGKWGISKKQRKVEVNVKSSWRHFQKCVCACRAFVCPGRRSW